MAALKDRLRADLTQAMKARDELTKATLRMVLSAVTNEEVAGKSARELTDDEVLGVLRRETKKRREAAEAFTAADRGESAEREKAEAGVLEGYLPRQLDDEGLRELIADAIADVRTGGPSAMGSAMKAAQQAVAGRADGGRVAAEVRRQLAS